MMIQQAIQFPGIFQVGIDGFLVVQNLEGRHLVSNLKHIPVILISILQIYGKRIIFVNGKA